LCMNGILKRQKSPDERVPILLMNGPDDPYQQHGDCRLHHYKYDDIVRCIDRLSYRRAQHREPVHIAFIGESIIRYQFMSFLRVCYNILFLTFH
jgi:hypothetical protein